MDSATLIAVSFPWNRKRHDGGLIVCRCVFASLTTVGSCFVAGGAFAADMSPVLKAPPAPAPVVDIWTGFYVGANGGYSWSQWDSTSISPIFPPNFTRFTASPDVNGWVAGIQGGYNWRINNTWLVGVEADVQWTGERATSATSTGPIVIGALTTTITSDVEWKFSWFDTFRGRVGALIDPTTLIYLTGGAAVGHFEFAQTTTAVVAATGGPVLASASVGFTERTTRWGGTVGAGVEKKFTPNWSAKAEFPHIPGRHGRRHEHPAQRLHRPRGRELPVLSRIAPPRRRRSWRSGSDGVTLAPPSRP